MGVNLQLATLLEYPTVERLADYIRPRLRGGWKATPRAAPKTFVRALFDRIETTLFRARSR
jgi:hypothetical protein